MFKISVFSTSLLILFMNFAKAEEISSLQISRDYDRNAIAAADKYENNRIDISGSIYSIGTDIRKTPIVSLYGRDDFNSVNMVVSKDDPYLLQISKYDFVHATCIVYGYTLGDVILRDCKISGFEKPQNTKE
ncbi:hypothetical protein OVA10_15565 [Lelliottia sp. SL45]|uniref:OB-fold protein n=1 Tax=Lelliottia sp. SL45 TaxID=2994665 RepID=UPI002275A881|nr:hypothetical protein [Lelliottia sp. SL45]MCY1699464.1 hypothetical protein [Lelliottia sp. SL45]